MEHFDLIFRFDNLEQTMTRYNGLSINQLAKFLQALSKTISTDEDEIVLSEIKGNCYAPVISTPSKTQYEKIKTLHSVISEGNYRALTRNERYYAKTLSEIMTKSIILNVYNTEKTYFKTIEKIGDTNVFKHYYATTSKRGYLTKIGSRNFDSKSSIFITSYPNEIEINAHQDAVLKNYYKKNLIEFYLTERINKETNKIEHTVLDDFKILDNTINFYENILVLREKHGAYFSKLREENEDE